jgi:hypothetical protein
MTLLPDQIADAKKRARAQLKALRDLERRSEGVQGGRSYEEHKAEAAARNKAMSAAGRDIGDVPKVADWARREKATKSLRAFCDTYGGQAFHMKWSDDHLRVLARLDEVIAAGGQFALAMPRGSGKTTMLAWAIVWALLTGRRPCVVLIAADGLAAARLLENIVGEISSNDELLADWPEVCYPMRQLEGIHQRAAGQLCRGQRTQIGITADELALPVVPRSAVERDEQMNAGGGIAICRGITGRIRGMVYRTPDGRVLRPSLVLIDDPQTDESAKSASQCEYRERLIMGSVMGLAGPGEKLAALATLTVIRPDDLADRLLTPAKHPSWISERTKLVYEWGTGLELWSQYAELRRGEGGAKAATKFYRKHRKAMDAGAKAGWPARKLPEELSAIQHAWNLRIDRGEAAFASEYQNEPLPETRSDAAHLDAEALADRVCGIPRGTVPSGATVLTAGIDVQQSCLYWVVVAWQDNATAWVVDWGTTPDQPHGRLRLGEISATLQKAHPGGGLESQLLAGCKACFDRLFAEEWRVEGGGSMRLDRAMIDANWQQSREAVLSAIKASPHSIVPARGRASRATHRSGLMDTPRRQGERLGLHWRMPLPARGTASVREAYLDSNWWRTWLSARLETAAGDPGAMLICGEGRTAQSQARELIEQLVSEERVTVEARGRRVEEWQLRQPGLDNHLWDALVMASVAASMEGVTLAETAGAVATQRRRERRTVSYEQWQTTRRGA